MEYITSKGVPLLSTYQEVTSGIVPAHVGKIQTMPPTEQDPYAIEKATVRLDGLAEGLKIHDPVVVQGRTFYVVDYTTYPSANRTVLMVERAALEKSPTVALELWQKAMGADGSLQPRPVYSSLPAVVVRVASDIQVEYASRHLGTTWWIYVEPTMAECVTGLTMFVRGKVQYKVLRVLHPGQPTRLPTVVCEENPWEVGT